MIHSLVGYPIRAAIWYQGESNHNEGMLDFEKKKALINGWREVWKQGDFPFYYVQIAPFQYGNEDPTILAKFWEAQAAVQQIPHTGVANGGGVKDASDAVYDYGDEKFPPMDGYGSMQIHNFAAGQTLFEINHWVVGNAADIGIGNSTGQTRDWTFTGNDGNYSSKRLRVFVRSK